MTDQDRAPGLVDRIASLRRLTLDALDEMVGEVHDAGNHPADVGALIAFADQLVDDARELRDAVVPLMLEHLRANHDRIDVDGLGAFERTHRRAGVKTDGPALVGAIVERLRREVIDIHVDGKPLDRNIAEVAHAQRMAFSALEEVAEQSGGDADVVAAARAYGRAMTSAAAHATAAAAGALAPSASWRTGVLAHLDIPVDEYQRDGAWVEGVRYVR